MIIVTQSKLNALGVDKDYIAKSVKIYPLMTDKKLGQVMALMRAKNISDIVEKRGHSGTDVAAVANGYCRIGYEYLAKAELSHNTMMKSEDSGTVSAEYNKIVENLRLAAQNFREALKYEKYTMVDSDGIKEKLKRIEGIRAGLLDDRRTALQAAPAPA